MFSNIVEVDYYVTTSRPGAVRTHTRHYFKQERKANVAIKQVPAILF